MAFSFKTIFTQPPKINGTLVYNLGSSPNAMTMDKNGDIHFVMYKNIEDPPGSGITYAYSFVVFSSSDQGDNWTETEVVISAEHGNNYLMSNIIGLGSLAIICDDENYLHVFICSSASEAVHGSGALKPMLRHFRKSPIMDWAEMVYTLDDRDLLPLLNPENGFVYGDSIQAVPFTQDGEKYALLSMQMMINGSNTTFSYQSLTVRVNLGTSAFNTQLGFTPPIDNETGMHPDADVGNPATYIVSTTFSPCSGVLRDGRFISTVHTYVPFRNAKWPEHNFNYSYYADQGQISSALMEQDLTFEFATHTDDPVGISPSYGKELRVVGGSEIDFIILLSQASIMTGGEPDPNTCDWDHMLYLGWYDPTSGEWDFPYRPVRVMQEITFEPLGELWYPTECDVVTVCDSAGNTTHTYIVYDRYQAERIAGEGNDWSLTSMREVIIDAETKTATLGARTEIRDHWGDSSYLSRMFTLPPAQHGVAFGAITYKPSDNSQQYELWVSDDFVSKTRVEASLTTECNVLPYFMPQVYAADTVDVEIPSDPFVMEGFLDLGFVGSRKEIYHRVKLTNTCFETVEGVLEISCEYGRVGMAVGTDLTSVEDAKLLEYNDYVFLTHDVEYVWIRWVNDTIPPMTGDNMFLIKKTETIL